MTIIQAFAEICTSAPHSFPVFSLALPALVQSLQKNVLHLLLEAKVLDGGWTGHPDGVGTEPWIKMSQNPGENHGFAVAELEQSSGKKTWNTLEHIAKLNKKQWKTLPKGEHWKTAHWKKIARLEKTHIAACRKLALEGLKKTGVGKCPNWTSPKYWGYSFQQILEGDVQNPQKGTFTDPWKNPGMCWKSGSQPVLEPVVSHHQAQGSREELAAGLCASNGGTVRRKPMLKAIFIWGYMGILPEILALTYAWYMVDSANEIGSWKGTPYINQSTGVVIYYDSFWGSAKVRLHHMRLWSLDVLSFGWSVDMIWWLLPMFPLSVFTNSGSKLNSSIPSGKST